MPVKITKDRVPEVLRMVRELTQREVLVGVPDINAGREPEPGEPPNISNAVIGYVMEFGDPERNIPARAFLVPGIRNALSLLTKQMRTGAEQALSGVPLAAEKAMHGAGLIAQTFVQRKITDGPFVPLAPMTLRQRRARGRTGEKPLIDTGQLRRAITYVLRKKGAGKR